MGEFNMSLNTTEKRERGRPNMDAEFRRDVVVGSAFTPAEVEAIKKYAQDNDMTVSKAIYEIVAKNLRRRKIIA
jgi:hypothetical protein